MYEISPAIRIVVIVIVEERCSLWFGFLRLSLPYWFLRCNELFRVIIRIIEHALLLSSRLFAFSYSSWSRSRLRLDYGFFRRLKFFL